MFCGKCGAKIKDDALYCDSCGAKIKDDALYCNSCGAEQTPVNSGNELRETKKGSFLKRHKKSIIISCAAVAGCICLIIALVLCFGANKNLNIKTVSILNIGDASVGDYITFGAFEQDNNSSNGKEPLEWLVLDKSDGKALLITKDAIYAKAYSEMISYEPRETDDISQWLNGTFIDTAFSSDEKAALVNAEAFLLSTDEAERYFATDEDRMCVPTVYAKAHDAWTSDYFTKDGEGTCWWWLQDDENNIETVPFVTDDGWVCYRGDFADSKNLCVRPAVWVNITNSLL